MSSTTSLTPLYSLPCSFHRQIVLIARDPHGKRKKYLFTGNAFTETDCECCPVLEGLDDLQIRGTQGFGFQKSHWGFGGNQLICVGIEWDKQLRNTKTRSGCLRYFVNSKGRVDIYEWSLIAKEFKKTGQLQIQLETSGAQANEAPLLLDFLLVPVDLKDCQLHGIVMDAKNHIGITQQYRWNRHRDQLEMIECRCRGESLKPSDDGYFELLREQSDGLRVWINGERKTMKRVLGPNGYDEKVMDSTWIRDLRAKSVEELAIIEASDQKLADCFEKEQVDDECWLIFPRERSGYSNDFLVERCGRVFERLSDAQSREPPAQGPSDPAQIPAFNVLALAEEVGRERGRGRPAKLLSMGDSLSPPPAEKPAGSVRLARGRPPQIVSMKKVPKESPPSTEEFDVEWNLKLFELVMADLSKSFSSDEQKKRIEELIILPVVLNRTMPLLKDTLTSEERTMIEKALRDCKIAQEFEEFQKKLVGEKEEEKPSEDEDFNWDGYDLNSDDEGTVKGGDSDSEESDMDYDDSEDVKQMAPESVITRDDDDGCSVITDITDYSLLEEKE